MGSTPFSFPGFPGSPLLQSIGAMNSMGATNNMSGLPGMGNMNGFGNMLGNAAARPTGTKQATFQPSKSLRDHITERLEKQSSLLTTAQERLDELAGIAYKARTAQRQKIGDQQISASDVEQIVATGSCRAVPAQASLLAQDFLMGPLPRSRGRRKHSKFKLFDFSDEAYDDYMGSMYTAASRGLMPQAIERMRQFQQVPAASSEDVQKTVKVMEKYDKVDPMRRYRILEAEIQALLRYSGVFGPNEYVDDPVTRNAALKFVLGTGRGDIRSAIMKKMPDDSDEEDSEAGSPGPPQSIQQPPMMYAPQPGQPQI